LKKWLEGLRSYEIKKISFTDGMNVELIKCASRMLFIRFAVFTDAPEKRNIAYSAPVYRIEYVTMKIPDG